MILPSNDLVVAEQCRRSYYRFIKEFWDSIIPEAPVLNWHIEYIANELQAVATRVINRQPKEYDLIINVPPGSTKTTITTIMLNPWVWTIDPTIRFITGSYSLELSRDHALKSRDIIKSDKYKALFGNVELRDDQDTKTNFANSFKGDRVATSVGGSITGKHAHIILIDDPINPKQADSEAERNNANNWIDKTLPTRKIDKDITPTILIMQRLHEDDPTGHMLAKGKSIKHICLPGELSKDVKPEEVKEKYIDGLFDPIRLSRNSLRDLKKDLGSRSFEGQVQQTPTPAEGNLFKRHWFKSFKLSDLPDNIIKNYYTDGAYGKEKSDNSATAQYAMYEGNLYIFKLFTWNLPFPEFINQYKNMLVMTGYTNQSLCVVEPKSMGISAVQQLRIETIQIGEIQTHINIIEDTPPSDSKMTRASACSPFVESGRVYLLEGETWIDGFLTECTTFPNAKNDDQVDTLSGIIGREILSKKHWQFGALPIR